MNNYPAVVRDEEGLAGLRARGVTRALTFWPEWCAAVRKLRKLHDGVENRPRPFPKALQGRRIAIHAGRFVGGRFGGYADGVKSVLLTALMSGWMAEGGLSLDTNFATLAVVTLTHKSRAGERVVLNLPQDIVTSAIVATGVLERVESPTPTPSLPWMVPTEPGEDDSYGWVFSGVEILDKPITVSGLQGIWTV